ncbi:MAG: hypothetical protein EZS28_023100, partial [Streblomastix strix]
FDAVDDDYQIPPASREEIGTLDVIKSRIISRDSKIIQAWNGGVPPVESTAQNKRSQSPNPVSIKIPSLVKVRVFPWFSGRILVKFKTIDGIIYTKAVDPNITVDEFKKKFLTNSDRCLAKPQDLKLCLIPRIQERGVKWTVMLDERKSLAHYKVRHEDTLTFVSSQVNKETIDPLPQRTLSFMPPNAQTEFTQGLRPICFKVTTTFGLTLNLSAFLNTTVNTLKLLIEDKIRIISEQSHRPNSNMAIMNPIKAENIQLLFSQQQLTNQNATLADLKLKDGETITIITQHNVQQGGDGLYIFARATTGNADQRIDGLTPQTTWNQVKQKVQEKMGIQVNKQRLILNGSEVDYNKTLVEYNIANGSKIAVLVTGVQAPAPPGGQQIVQQAKGGVVQGQVNEFITVKLTKKDKSISDLQIKLEIAQKSNQRLPGQGQEVIPFTVLWLKKQIIQSGKIPESELWLTYLGEGLNDEKSLQYYNIRGGDILLCTQL